MDCNFFQEVFPNTRVCDLNPGATGSVGDTVMDVCDKRTLWNRKETGVLRKSCAIRPMKHGLAT